MNKNFLKVAMALILTASPIVSNAATIVLGSDYLRTSSAFLKADSPVGGWYSGNPNLGFGNADTVVSRLGDCTGIDLSSDGSSCTVSGGIEVVALSLIQDASPNTLVRKSSVSVPAGSMTLYSNGSGTGGTYNSSFTVNYELSVDNGLSWFSGGNKTFTSTGSVWSIFLSGYQYDGLVGNQAANNHTNLTAGQYDFFSGAAFHDTGNGSVHGINAPIPAAVWLFSSGLLGLFRFRKNSLTA